MHFEIQHLLHTKTVNKIQWTQFNADVSHWKFPALERETAHSMDDSASTIEDMYIMSLSRSHEGSCAT